MTFAYPYLLLLLLIIPAYIGLYAWSRYSRRRRLRRFGHIDTMAPLMPEVSKYKAPLKLVVRSLALFCIIVALARPWGGVISQNTEKRGCEVVIAVDASNSMLASTDGNPDGTPRMRTAKTILEKLIGRLDNDRVGLIVYAGQAYTLIPVTSDYVSARVFLNSIDPEQIQVQGTDIAQAIRTAMGSFSQRKDIGKAIILITDAEDLEDPEQALQMAREAHKAGVQLNVIGIGSQTPSTIPYHGSYITDETGAPVATALNEDLAAQMAQAGGGIYVNASNSDALNELLKQIATVKKTALQSSQYAVHDELFTIFLWIAITLLCIDVFLLDRKIRWLSRITFFNKMKK